MKKETKQVPRAKFFLGAMTGLGFKSELSELQKEKIGHLILLQGAPASGKAALLEHLADNVSDGVECIYYPQEPTRLVGVVFYRNAKFQTQGQLVAVVDASSPQSIEAHALGLREQVIDMGGVMNVQYLQSQVKAEQIETLLDQVNCLQMRAARYIASAGGLLFDSQRAVRCVTNLEKVRRYTNNLCARLFPPLQRTGNVMKRRLTAITSEGVVSFADTASALATQIFVIDDPYGAVSKEMFSILRHEIVARGYECVVCPCALFGDEKIEHVIVPERKIAFLTSNVWHNVQFEQANTIHYTRFTDKDALKNYRARLRFNRKAAKALLNQCSDLLAQLCEKQLEMREIYRPAMDFTKQAQIKCALEKLCGISSKDS